MGHHLVCIYWMKYGSRDALRKPSLSACALRERYLWWSARGTSAHTTLMPNTAKLVWPLDCGPASHTCFYHMPNTRPGGLCMPNIGEMALECKVAPTSSSRPLPSSFPWASQQHRQTCLPGQFPLQWCCIQDGLAPSHPLFATFGPPNLAPRDCRSEEKSSWNGRSKSTSPKKCLSPTYTDGSYMAGWFWGTLWLWLT